MEKSQWRLIIKAVILIVFVFIILFITINFYPHYKDILSSPQEFKDYILSFGQISIIIFWLMQVAQVVIAAIPGEAIQMAGGYIYGTLWGTVYSFVGILAGSFIAFYISRILGYSLLKLFISESSFKKFEFLMNTNKYEVAIFILFLMPGFPKDLLTYLAGVTPIKPGIFFLISMVGRIPGILASSYIGANIVHGNYIQVAIAAAMAAFAVLISLLYKERIMKFLNGKIHRR